MKLEKKKTPDKTEPKLNKRFPQFAFRMPGSEDGKKAIKVLHAEADKIRSHRNGRLDKDQFKLINKNDVFLEALRLGLSEIIKKEKI
jgi:hypothetical protein